MKIIARFAEIYNSIDQVMECNLGDQLHDASVAQW